jgi:hypothetical protein
MKPTDSNVNKPVKADPITPAKVAPQSDPAIQTKAPQKADPSVPKKVLGDTSQKPKL